MSSTVDYVVSLTNLIGEDRFAKVVAAAEKSVPVEEPAHRRKAAVERAKTTLFAEAKSLAKKQATEKAMKDTEALGAEPSSLQVSHVFHRSERSDDNYRVLFLKRAMPRTLTISNI